VTQILILFIYLSENLEEPSTVPRPLALTGITVHTKSITSNDCVQMAPFIDNQCYQSYMTSEILKTGQVYTLK